MEVVHGSCIALEYPHPAGRFRILAISAAIALHVLAFLMLICDGLQAPTLQQTVREPWIVPMEPVKPVVPVNATGKTHHSANCAGAATDTDAAT